MKGLVLTSVTLLNQLKTVFQKALAFLGLRLVRTSRYVEPVAPFDVLELAVLVQLFKKEDDFYFVQIGADDGVPADTLNSLIRKYRLRGCCQMETFESFIDALPVQKISMLFIDTEGSDDKIIGRAFQAGIYPSIIHYEWTEMSIERRYLLKVKLLDNGYRFIDVGADTVCVREEYEER